MAEFRWERWDSEILQGNLSQNAIHLVQKKPRTSRFYLLPKIHKPDNPGRPIVSACSCPTELLSSYLDDILQPFVTSLDSYVRDSTDVLRKLQTVHVDPNVSLLFTMDVKSLYTVIPHNDGLCALRYYLDRRSVHSPPTDTTIRLAELVLTLNNFEFGDDHYDQVKGISMGTKMGPSFACLFMGWLEERFFQTFQGISPTVYFRYIDDIFGIFQGTHDEFSKFHEDFNNFHPSS